LICKFSNVFIAHGLCVVFSLYVLGLDSCLLQVNLILNHQKFYLYFVECVHVALVFFFSIVFCMGLCVANVMEVSFALLHLWC
jgi:hypothetical protein